MLIYNFSRSPSCSSYWWHLWLVPFRVLTRLIDPKLRLKHLRLIGTPCHPVKMRLWAVARVPCPSCSVLFLGSSASFVFFYFLSVSLFRLHLPSAPALTGFLLLKDRHLSPHPLPTSDLPTRRVAQPSLSHYVSLPFSWRPPGNWAAQRTLLGFKYFLLTAFDHLCANYL